MVAATSPPPLLADRYQRLGVIGRGATGTVYRAVDRLNRRRVALKTLTTEPASHAAASDVTLSQPSASGPALLEREFRLIAGLRHPNVVASLDYAIGEDGQPFFTMDLQEDARTLRDAAAGCTFAAKLELLVQLLHALAYLHRRGLVHRDVKPENALCVGGVVKLIDFGLVASTRDAERGACGTLAYAAPEILRGAAADERADLYAVGIVAYEIFAGRHPFDVTSPAKLLQSVFASSADLSVPGIDPAAAPVLARLLARDPKDRFGDAIEVIAAFEAALRSPLAIETRSTRASFLHGAELVGRDAELARLRRALPHVVLEDRKAVLVGGESGAGKTRLLEELATEAMVRDVRVLRGQALREGARPYEVWRGVLRLLMLLAGPGELEASVLKGVIPDVELLLERDVADAPELDPEAAHLRLTRVLEALLRRCKQPVVILLEDLQWAGIESLKLFARVQALSTELRVLVVASYRSDERPDLPNELPGVECIELERLPASAVAHLCASITGDRTGDRSDDPSSRALAELVSRESRGNVFLALELMRALAEAAGGLERVSALALSSQPFTGHIDGLVHGRVEHLSEDDRAFLRVAAVAGRELDLELLASLHPKEDVEACANRAVEAGVLSSVQGRWWFAHDKLREALMDALPEEQRREIHARLAAAISAIAPGNASTLAHHYAGARDAAREQEYAALAGDLFLRSGAYHEAIPYLRRALVLSTTADRGLAKGPVQRRLGEALFRSGQLVEAREMFAAALATLGRPLPPSRSRLIGRMAVESCVQLALRARRRARPVAPAAEVAQLEETILVYTQLSRVAVHLNDEELVLHVTLSALNLAERGQLLAHRARLAAVMGAVMGIMPVHRWARFYFELAQTLSAQLDDPAIHALVLAHQGYYEAGIGKWQECREHLEQSMTIYDQVGDVRLREESVSILAYAMFFHGEVKRSEELYRMLERSGEERLDTQITGWGLANRIKVLVRTGRLEHVDELSKRVEKLLVDKICTQVWDGVRAERELARGDLGAARRAAGVAAARLEASASRSFMTCTTYGVIAQALLACWKAASEAGRSEDATELRAAAAKANRALAKIAGIFPIAEAARLVHAGTFELLSGRPERARPLWEQAARTAESREQPYEEALALTALAELPGAVDRRAKLERARMLLDRMGAVLPPPSTSVTP
jgi:tetratricopeptide (TPR) repeat protein